MAGVVPMTKRNIICVLVCVIILLLIIVFIPYPQRINKVVPAYIDKENTYTMSIKAWKLNYLFKVKNCFQVISTIVLPFASSVCGGGS